MRNSSRERRSARHALRHALCLGCALFFAAGKLVEAGTPTKGSIGGKVVDESNAPLPGVTVLLLSAGQGTKLDERKTDPSGSFLFAGLIPGAFQLAFLPPEGTDLVGDTFLNQTPPPPLKVEAGRVIHVARTLKKGGRLEISFLRESGPWVPTSCPCTFDLSSPGSAVFKEPDVVDGRLLYRGLPARDDYRLSFEPEGHASQVINAISIRSGQPTHVSVRYDPDDPTGLAGTLRMPDGTPIGDTMVTVRSLDQAESAVPAGSAKTDSGGKLKIVGLRPGIYVLTAGRRLGQVTVVQGTIVDVDLVFDSQVGSSGVLPRMLAFLDWLSPPAFLTLLPSAPTSPSPSPPGCASRRSMTARSAATRSTWQVTVPAGGSRILRFEVALPDLAGRYIIETTVKANGLAIADPPSFTAEVPRTTEGALADAIAALESTTVEASDRGALESAIALLRAAQAVGTGPLGLELRIRLAAEACEALGRVRSADLGAERASVDWLIAAWERAWHEWSVGLASVRAPGSIFAHVRAVP